MKFAFHPDAEAEFFDAIEYYESREPELGLDFAQEVQSAIRNILSFPRTWPVLEGEIRRCLVQRFPYGILYSVEPESIFIIAVMNLHREPGYWKDRLR